MRAEAAEAGIYNSPSWSKHPRIQIITIEELLEGRGIDYPKAHANATFKRAPQKKRAVKDKPQRLPNM